MGLPVLTAILGPREAALVAALDAAGTRLTVVRRCADLAEVRSAAEAGLAEAAVLSEGLQRLDLPAVEALHRAGVAVVALAGERDDSRTRLERIGADVVLDAAAAGQELVEAVQQAVVLRQAETARTAPALVADPQHALPAARAVGPEDSARRSGGSGAGRTRPPATSGETVGRGDGLLVAVWGPAGAPGRTTVAIGLAAALARRGAGDRRPEVLLVDADTHGASVAQALGLLDESAGLAAAARAATTGRLTEERLLELAPEVAAGLRVLTGLAQPRRWSELRPAALEEVWAQARRIAGWTVVDAGFGVEADEELMFDVAAPRRHAATLSALQAADLVLAVGAAEPVGLQRLLVALPDLAEVVPPGVPVRVVLNRVRESAVGRPADDLVRAALDRYAGVRDVVLLPDERDLHDAAMLAGRSVLEHAPASRSAQRLAELADLVAGALGDPELRAVPRRGNRGSGGWFGRGR